MAVTKPTTLSPAIIASAAAGDATALATLEALSAEQREALLKLIPDEKVRKAMGRAMRELLAEDFGAVEATEVNSDGNIVATIRPNWGAKRFNRKDGTTLHSPLASFSTGGEAGPVFKGPDGYTYRCYAAVVRVNDKGAPDWR